MSRHSLELEMQSTEKTAEKAQAIMTSLKEAAMMNPMYRSTATAKTSPNSSESRSSTEAKSKRAQILITRKQKMRNRNSFTAEEQESNGKASEAEHDIRLSASESAERATKKLDKYGFILNMDSNGQVFDTNSLVEEDEEVPTYAESLKTQKREKQWAGMMASWELTKRRRKRLSKSLRKGIPDGLRGNVWTLLGSVPKKIRESPLSFDDHVCKSLESAGQGAPGRMQRMRSESLVNSHAFHVTQETIERDIHRTYPRHDLFHEDVESSDEEEGDAGGLLDALNDDQVGSILKQLDKKHHHHPDDVPKNFHVATGGQAALRRVLRAYSVYDRDVGYCQGMNFIAGMFLTFMSEEEAFWLLVFVMTDPPCRMRGLFGEGMKETHMVLYIAEKLTYQFLPKLAKHMEEQSIHITMYATQWLLTLYTSSFQFDLVTRVWDCFLAEGYKVVYRVMLALLQESQAVLLTLTFEDILAHFRELPKNTNGAHILSVALKIPLRHKHLSKHEKDFYAQQEQQERNKQR